MNSSLRKGKGAWKTDEDQRCKEAVNNLLDEMNCLLMFELDGELPKRFSWIKVSNYVKTRTRKQCRNRYINNLHPFLKRTPWTLKEDHYLKELQLMQPNCWQKISKQLVGRSPNEIKMRSKSLKLNEKAEKQNDIIDLSYQNEFDFLLSLIFNDEKKGLKLDCKCT